MPSQQLTFLIRNFLWLYPVWPRDARTEYSGYLQQHQLSQRRVERAHLMLQDRLVKELRLRGMSSVDATNDFADEFMAEYNRHLAKGPPGMTLMSTGHLKMMTNWKLFSHGGNPVVFQSP